MFLRSTYVPAHGENRMAHEGDVGRARRVFFESSPTNLKFLLQNRYQWMNQFIPAGGRGIEVGCGSGLSREFIQASEYRLTDYAEHP
ncbi:MAG: class I SAM-dependent methyltransferase, partial [Gemmataceae bacterium]